MKKYVGYMVAFVFGTYLWFVLLPMWFNYSFPTGGWDWLGFVGVVGGLFLSVWCLKKQQELSVVPCLDVDAYSTLDNNAQNKVFRILKTQMAESTMTDILFLEHQEKRSQMDLGRVLISR